jgi:DNA polymerase-3 subunit delta
VIAMRAAAECNEAVKGGTEDREYALERTIMLFARARQGGAR